MTPELNDLMRDRLKPRVTPGQTVIDVGSLDVNGTHEQMLAELELNYLGGVDIRNGENVDWVVPEFGVGWDVPGADIVISGSCLEHVVRPWEWIQNVFSITNPGGLVVIIAPWKWRIHPFPKDCWRVLPDGMQGLLEFAGFTDIETDVRDLQTFGVARRPIL